MRAWSGLIRLAVALAAMAAALGLPAEGLIQRPLEEATPPSAGPKARLLSALPGQRHHAAARVLSRRLLHEPAWDPAPKAPAGASSGKCEGRPVLDVYLAALSFGDGRLPAGGRANIQCSSDGEGCPPPRLR